MGDVIQQREVQGNAMWEDYLNYSCTAVVSELIVTWQENTQASRWITWRKDLLLAKQQLGGETSH